MGTAPFTYDVKLEIDTETPKIYFFFYCGSCGMHADIFLSHI